MFDQAAPRNDAVYPEQFMGPQYKELGREVQVWLDKALDLRK